MKRICKSILFSFIFVLSSICNAGVYKVLSDMVELHKSQSHHLLDGCIFGISLGLFFFLFLGFGFIASILKIGHELILFFFDWFKEDVPMNKDINHMAINLKDDVLTNGYVEFKDGSKVPLYITELSINKIIKEKKDE